LKKFQEEVATEEGRENLKHQYGNLHLYSDENNLLGSITTEQREIQLSFNDTLKATNKFGQKLFQNNGTHMLAFLSMRKADGNEVKLLVHGAVYNTGKTNK
jgi:hypothetical protein